MSEEPVKAPVICPCGKEAKRKGCKVCEDCRDDPKLYQKAVYVLSERRTKARIEREAAEQTEGLPEKETYTPMMGEYAVWMMLRDQWR